MNLTTNANPTKLKVIAPIEEGDRTPQSRRTSKKICLGFKHLYWKFENFRRKISKISKIFDIYLGNLKSISKIVKIFGEK